MSHLSLTLWEEYRQLTEKDGSSFSLHKREASHTKKGTRFLTEVTIAPSSKSSRKRLTLPSEGRRNTTAFFFLFYRFQLTGDCPDDSVTLRNQETTIGAVCGNGQAGSHRGGTQDLGYTRYQVTLRSSRLFLFPNIPQDRRNSAP